MRRAATASGSEEAGIEGCARVRLELEACRGSIWETTGKMDDYMFKYFVDECRVVEEKTSYIEIFNYSVSSILARGISSEMR